MNNIDHLFYLGNEIIEADMLHPFLLSGGTRIDNNEYLESLENATGLIVCTEEQIQKLLICFELKRYLTLNVRIPDKLKKVKFLFSTSLRCLKRFYEGLKGLYTTFSGTTKKCENKNLTHFLFQYSFQKWTGL